jgi:hypothetical protein
LKKLFVDEVYDGRDELLNVLGTAGESFNIG